MRLSPLVPAILVWVAIEHLVVRLLVSELRTGRRNAARHAFNIPDVIYTVATAKHDIDHSSTRILAHDNDGGTTKSTYTSRPSLAMLVFARPNSSANGHVGTHPAYTECDVKANYTLETHRKHCGDIPETSLKHPGEIPDTTGIHPGYILDTTWRHAGDMPETCRRHPGDILETDWRHPGDTPETPWIHPGDTLETSRRHPGDILDTTWRHPGYSLET